MGGRGIGLMAGALISRLSGLGSVPDQDQSCFLGQDILLSQCLFPRGSIVYSCIVGIGKFNTGGNPVID